MKVLAGVDGTDKSLAAIRFAARLMSAKRDHVTLFFAPPRRRWSQYLQLSTADQETTLSAFAHSVFERAEAELPAEFPRSRLQGDGEQDVGRALLAAAKRLGSDLIVLGTGRSSHRLPFFVGGVAHTVIHEADRPVLACRQESATGTGPLNVLLAADPNEPLGTAATLLSQINWPADSRGLMIHVMDYVEDERLRHWLEQSDLADTCRWSDAMDQDVAEWRGRAAQELITWQSQLPPLFQQREPTLVLGHVVEQLVAVIEREGIDLIVVGGHHRGPVARLLGSTTEGLLLQANASLLVLHGNGS